MSTKNLKTKNEAEDKQLALQMNLAEDAGAGMEGADKSSFAIPFISVLQGLSPQLETVEGARPGLFTNTITEELYKEVRVIPCAFQRRYLRWAPREVGGGFKGEYLPQDIDTGRIQTELNERGQPTIDDDLLKDTRSHFVLVESANGTWQPALISMSSTQIKKSKRWMSLINGIEMTTPQGKRFTPPSFGFIYRVRAVKEENSQGAWWGMEVSLDCPVDDPELYARAKEFHASVTAGDVEVLRPESEEEGTF